MATDGALGGAVDNAFRTAYDGGGVNEVLEAGAEGFIGGAIMSPMIGGGMKAVGKAGHKIGEKMHGGAKAADEAAPAPKITENEPEEVAPFAQRLEKSSDIEDLTNPEIREVKLENGEFNENGGFYTGWNLYCYGVRESACKEQNFQTVSGWQKETCS